MEGALPTMPRHWPQYVDAVRAHVGSPLDQDALLKDLVALKIRYSQLASWRGGKGAKQREQKLLQRHKLAARFLALEESADPPRSGMLPVLTHSELIKRLQLHVEQLACEHNSMTRSARWQIALKSGPKYETAKALGVVVDNRFSTFERLVGGPNLLKALFKKHFHGKPGKGRTTLQPDSPYIRFVALTLDFLHIRTSTGKPHSREAILRAMSPRKAVARCSKGKKHKFQ